MATEMDEPIAKKAYYSIGEVCDLTGLKPHVLRYWEAQLTSLAPTKNRAGNRVYRPADIEMVLLVKHLLYEEKFTIEGVDRRIRELRKEGELGESKRRILEPDLLSGMRDELLRLRTLLEPPSRDR
jgi:DNA-binding transcriptional MerR regulator